MNIALIGYGKMGHVIERIAISRGHNIVCTIDAGEETKFSSIEFGNADVAIEFSTPRTAQDNILRAWEVGKPVVSGTTGWDVKQFKLQHKPTQSLFWTSNYSIGVNLFFALNRYVASIIKPYEQYKASITETHHIHKLDAPSGTAKSLAEDIVQFLGKSIDIESIREGEVPGTHTVEYDSETDKIILTHEAKSRDGFALGAVVAAEWLVGKSAAYYDMNDLMKL